MKLRLSDRAKAELRTIRNYTFENHGPRQVAIYSGALAQAFKTLRVFPQIGLVDKRLPPGHQAFKASHHWLCYEVDGDYIDVKAIVRELSHFENPPEGVATTLKCQERSKVEMSVRGKREKGVRRDRQRVRAGRPRQKLQLLRNDSRR